MKKALFLTSLAFISLNAKETDSTEALANQIDQVIEEGYAVGIAPSADFDPSIENCNALLLASANLRVAAHNFSSAAGVNELMNKFLARLEKCVEKRAQERAEKNEPKTIFKKLKSLVSQNKPTEETLFDRLRN